MIRYVLFVFLSAMTVFSTFANDVKNLTIYDAGIAQFSEERIINLQTGINQIEWRSLMPKVDLRTVRVVADNAEVVRQDITFDGVDVKNEKSAVLQLIINNRATAGNRRITVDYLAPNISWQNNYSLILNQTNNNAPPTSATLDSWVSVTNQTGTDLNAETVDLIAGEIALFSNNADNQIAYLSNGRRATSQITTNSSYDGEDSESLATSASQISAFTRFRLGTNINLTANKIISRFPIFQQAKLNVVQRNVFENEYNAQTLGRGGFALLPKGLEVRLIAKNPTKDAMPAGQVTIYTRTNDGLTQIVGQDRINLTPVANEFTVAQGRSNTIVGTRRILERKSAYYQDENKSSREKLTTKIEITLTNRGSIAAEAFVRENIEPYAQNEWQIIESSLPKEQFEKLGTNAIQTKVNVPANGKITVTYTVETR